MKTFDEWRTWIVRTAVVVLAVLLSCLMVVTGSRAAFSGTTDNTGNSFAAGNVTLTDDDTGLVAFNVAGLKALDSLRNCVEVTYTGSLTSNVRLYAANLAGTGLDDYLNLTIERGTGQVWGAGTLIAPGDNCSAGTWTNTETVYSGTLDGWAAAQTNFATGGGTWDGATTNDAFTYRFTLALQDDNAAQGLDATLDLVWEAQNQ